MVLDVGYLVEFDTPQNLFDKNESIFRGMCEAAGIHSISTNSYLSINEISSLDGIKSENIDRH